MNKRIWYEKYARSYVSSLLVSVAVVLLLNGYLSLQINEIALVLITAVWIGILKIIDHNRHQPVLYIVMAMVLVISIVLVTRDMTEFGGLVKEYSLWWKDRENIASMKSSYSLFTFFLLLLGCSLPIYIMQRWNVTRRVVCGIISLCLLVLIARQELVSKLAIICFLCYLLQEVEEWLVAKYVVHKNHANVVTFLYPIFFLMMLALLCIPISSEPIQWKGIKSVLSSVRQLGQSVVDAVRETLDESYGEYSVKITGFSESSNLGGDIVKDDQIVMHLTMDKLYSERVYLFGNGKNVYEKNSWSEAFGSDCIYDKEEYQLDYIEFLYALYRYDSFENSGDWMGKVHINVTYDSIHTRSIFLPLKSKLLEKDGSPMKLQGDEYNVKTTGLQGEDFSYYIDALALNYGGEEFRRFVISQEGYLYGKDIEKLQAMEEALRNEYLGLYVKIPNNIHELLEKRRESIYSNFTKVGEDVPERVTNLAKEITKNCTTTYEKLKAIEQYLTQYTYTLTPGAVPKDRELVDYFLFDSQEGYCTYFATAMAVMGRAVGVPTRYMQGFSVPTKKEKMVVTNVEAHAWVDAYIDGIGWVSFEPTASYSEGFYTGWKGDSEGNPGTPAATSTPDNDSRAEWLEQLKEQAKQEELLKEKQAMNQRQMYTVLGKVVLSIVLLGIVFVIVLLIYRRKRAMMTYHRASENDKLETDMKRFLYLLFFTGRRIKPGETLARYMERMNEESPNDRVEYGRIGEIYAKMRYGEETILLEELEEVQRGVQLLKKGIKQEMHPIKYSVLCMKLQQISRLNW